MELKILFFEKAKKMPFQTFVYYTSMGIPSSKESVYLRGYGLLAWL
jgi:hypothetical protein